MVQTVNQDVRALNDFWKVIDSDNPLPTTQQLTITQSINETAYDLAAATYSQIVTPAFDYIIDNFQLDFSTTESRTITLTSSNGTKIYESTNTNLSVALGSINFGQASGDSFTLAITQTSGACTVDIALYIKNSPVALTADPILAAGSNTIGRVDSNEGLAIAKGDVSGLSFVHKFGNTPDFDSSDGVVTVWDGANDGGLNEMTYTYSTTADIDRLSSSNAGDTVDIEVQGLDTNFDLVTQTITLTGQTPVALTTSLVRVFRMKNVGSTDVLGFVYCFVNGTTTSGVPDTTSDVRAMINDSNNQTLMATYTIPNGKTGYLRSWFASTAGASKSTNYEINLFARPSGQVFQLKNRSAIGEQGTSHVQHKYFEPEKFAAKTDIEIRAATTASPITAATVSAGFDIVLVDD